MFSVQYLLRETFSLMQWPGWGRRCHIGTFQVTCIINTSINNKKNIDEYDQEIPQSRTADKPVASRGRATHQLRDTRKTKQSKATSSLFPIEMIAKLERTQSNAQKIIEQLQNPTMGVTVKKESQKQNHYLRTDSNQGHRGA